jgi:catalase
MARKTLTTEQGVPVADHRNPLAAMQYGPVLFQEPP